MKIQNSMKALMMAFSLMPSLVAQQSDDNNVVDQFTSVRDVTPVNPSPKFKPKGKAWALSTYAIGLEQDLKSNRDASSIEERRWGTGLGIEWLKPKCHLGEMAFGLRLGYLNSKFDYRDDEGALELDGWQVRFDYRLEPKLFPQASLHLFYGQAFMEGRDFEDSVAGRQGLQIKSKCSEEHYGAQLEYRVFDRIGPEDQKHQIGLFMGLEERVWNMNVGWLTNSEEDMSLIEPWSMGARYSIYSRKKNVGAKFEGAYLSQGLKGSINVFTFF